MRNLARCLLPLSILGHFLVTAVVADGAKRPPHVLYNTRFFFYP